jgi:hypothetical protein
MTQSANLAALGSNASSTGTLGASSFASATIPNSALSGNPTFRNRIINGGMVIDQRNAGASVALTGALYTLDRWQTQAAASSKLTAQQSSTAPAGFINSLLFTVVGTASLGSTDTYRLIQKIEGLNVSDLAWGTANAQPVTLSFWVRGSVTGTYGASIQNSDNNRSYPFTYVINSANTYEYKTVTIPGDTTGTWLTTNGVGLYLMWGLGVGSTLSGTAGAWAAGDYRSVTGATSVVGTNGATFYITGVQLERGSAASPFENRLYGTELALCQRYYQVFYPAAQELIYNESNTSSGKFWQLYLPVPMRATPTATYSSGMTGGSVIGLSGTISSLSLTSASVNRVSTRVTMSTNTGSANLIYHCDSFDGDSVGLASEL